MTDERDIAAALKHLGFDSVADLHYWAKDDNELNRFDALVAQFADHRLAAISAVMQDLEAPSEGMIEFAARAIIMHNWPNMPAIDIDEMWDGQIGNAAAAIKAIAQYCREQA